MRLRTQLRIQKSQNFVSFRQKQSESSRVENSVETVNNRCKKGKNQRRNQHSPLFSSPFLRFGKMDAPFTHRTIGKPVEKFREFSRKSRFSLAFFRRDWYNKKARAKRSFIRAGFQQTFFLIIERISGSRGEELYGSADFDRRVRVLAAAGNLSIFPAVSGLKFYPCRKNGG